MTVLTPPRFWIQAVQILSNNIRRMTPLTVIYFMTIARILNRRTVLPTTSRLITIPRIMILLIIAAVISAVLTTAASMLAQIAAA